MKPIPILVEPPPSFVEGPGPGKDWWEKALSEKSFSARKNENSQQNRGVDAKSRTTTLGPFGEPIRMTGWMARANPFRFSTKYDDDESDLLYYGYRYYKPSTGTWVSRDQGEELGFKVLRIGGDAGVSVSVLNADFEKPYLFLGNEPIDGRDLLGLCNGKCGEDVTKLVYSSLLDIQNTYASASSWKQFRAVENMFNVPSFESWDITWLKDYYSKNWAGSPWCNNTVTFAGRCVSVDELNYMMYGWAIKVTDEDYEFAMDELAAGLKHRLDGDPPDVISRKLGFARYAYSGYPGPYTSVPSSLAWPRPCPVDSKPPPRPIQVHKWKWTPLRDYTN